MEDRLTALIDAGRPESRDQFAHDWKKAGGQVFGLVGPYDVPEELITAAGMLPFRLRGAARANTPLASAYRPANSCVFGTHLLEAILAGDYQFLDGVIFTDRFQDLVRVWDVWARLQAPPFKHILHVPHLDTPVACGQYRADLEDLREHLSTFIKRPISVGALEEAIGLHNDTRDLLGQLYGLRKRLRPPLSGAETLAITLAATYMPKARFNAELASLLPYLATRDKPLAALHPRVLVTSDLLDNPAYVSLVESTGCFVAMDDLDSGSRYFWQPVASDSGDPLGAIAERYVTRPGCARMLAWDAQVRQVIAWVHEYAVDGVVELRQVYCRPPEMRTPFFIRELTNAGIPSISLRREYHLANAGQLSTRIGAFVEMLRSGLESRRLSII